MSRKHVLASVLAAVLILALSAEAFAAKDAVTSPQEAKKAALEQIKVWKDMGLLNPDVRFEGEPDAVVEIEESNGGERWFNRLFPHSYDVRWYLRRGDRPDPEPESGKKYGCNLRVDARTGKLTMIDIDALADKDAIPVREEELPTDSEKPETWYFYDNYSDIFPADMTVDRFCALLAEYWGFSGYTLTGTNDAEYAYRVDAIDGSTPLKELNEEQPPNYYLTVFFDGDQEGAPMYIQLHQFPGYVTLSVGTGHAVG